ncbi:polysaccharide biosynthesis/export family protein [Yunchengibacter salinarum]|uniref:polysaccharide biosynthesis/export family protein n=1 Tax=Yunchengibacter salinarum TaxID=3133399 RepID=UPI0035B68714
MSDHASFLASGFWRRFAAFWFLALALIAVPVAAQNQNVTQDAAPVPEARQDTVREDKVFGHFLFSGEFANQSFQGFNPAYQVSVGDTVRLQLWGGFEFSGEVPVDAQGNIFIPSVGPVPVEGVANGDLNRVVTAAIKGVFKRNVGVYASLNGAKPVKVFVTGFVRQPGLYAGHAADSVLFFLDRAGGIDPRRGSFLTVKLLRDGEAVSTINLYDFILTGKMPSFQIHDGDTIIVEKLRSQAGVKGEVQNPGLFEFKGNSADLGRLLDLAGPYPHATHVRINRNSLRKSRVEYLSISAARKASLSPGDMVHVVSDKMPGTISVRVEGEHRSPQEFILPYGARLGDLLEQVEFGQNAEKDAIQLIRQSVKRRQKDMLNAQLRALESSVLTARSRSKGEAELRAAEAEMILQWVKRAQEVEPEGRISLARASSRMNILLEPGDVVRIPRSSNLVMVHGDVLFPNATAYQKGHTIEDYIEQAGGFTQDRDRAHILLLHTDGTFEKVDEDDIDDKDLVIAPGDEIFVMPKVQVKSFQLATEIISIFYQLALSAGVVLGI